MPYIVTIKLPRNPNHDPHNKVTGTCPASLDGETCTDVTGEHHSLLVRDQEAMDVWLNSGVHVTRVEQVLV